MREAQWTSVFRDHRPTEAVVDPGGNHIDILRNVFVMVQLRNEGRITGHANVATTHEQMIALDCEQPVRRPALDRIVRPVDIPFAVFAEARRL
jgi:hypothetical protein